MIDFRHQFFHCATLVIPGDVGMQITPHTLDAVMIGTIRWQEVQHNPAVELREAALV